ncbi:BED zinc finger domain-containing protein [Apiospora arundinis]
MPNLPHLRASGSQIFVAFYSVVTPVLVTIGKLHNIVHWVQRSGQRIEKLHKLQYIENTALSLEDKTTYDVMTDNATRWNSSEAMMERGYMLRNALDSLVQAEVTEWNQYVARRTQNGTKPMPKKGRKKPAIVDDKMAAEDWSVIAEYAQFLGAEQSSRLRMVPRREDGGVSAGRPGKLHNRCHV